MSVGLISPIPPCLTGNASKSLSRAGGGPVSAGINVGYFVLHIFLCEISVSNSSPQVMLSLCSYIHIGILANSCVAFTRNWAFSM